MEPPAALRSLPLLTIIGDAMKSQKN